MPNQKFSDLSEDTPVGTDHVAIARGTASNKKVLLSALQTLINSTLTADVAGGGNEITNIGHFGVTHTAIENGDIAVLIVCDAAGFGDAKCLFIDYIAGAVAAGENESSVLVNIDRSTSTGGTIVAYQVLATEGSAVACALEAGVGIAPVFQQSGTFTDMDSALVKAVDSLTAFTTSDPAGANNVDMFVADNDTITIGDAAKFSEIEFLLEVVASGGGIKPTFEYSTGIGTWAVFSPVDGTNGMKETGIISWLLSDLGGWLVGTGSEFLIRITRTQNTLSTVPTEDLVQIAATVVFEWDENGILVLPAQEWAAQQGFNGTALTALGADQVLDGDMDTTASWTVQGTGWTVDDAVAGQADCTGAQGGDTDLTQTPATALVNGSTYQVIYDVTTYVAGNITPVIGGTEGTDRSSTGTDITEYIVAGAGADIDMRGDSAFDGAIDNVRVKLANVSWDLDTGQVATLTLDADLVLDNPTNMQDGTKYDLRIIQDGSGSHSLTYGNAYKYPGTVDPVLTAAAAGRSQLKFISDGSLMHGEMVQQTAAQKNLALQRIEHLPALVLGNESTALSASTSVAKIRWTIRQAFELTAVHGECTVAPTDDTMELDVHVNGTTILTGKIDILTGTREDDGTVALATTTLAAGDVIEGFVDVIGSTIAGAGAKIQLLGYQL